MSRTHFIEHKGVRIMYLNFADVRSQDEALTAIDEARAIIQQQPKGSLLTLTNVSDSTYDLVVVRALWKLARDDKPFVKAGAVVGLDGMKREILHLVTRVARRTLPAFSTIDEAKDWLVTQA